MKMWPAVVLLSVALSGCAGATGVAADGAARKTADDRTAAAERAEPIDFEINGSLTVTGASVDDPTSSASPCRTRGGYTDISSGAQVVVRDEDDRTVATSWLDDGYSVEDLLGRYTSCRFDILVVDVPEGSKFYSIEVSHRGAVTYSREDLDQPVEMSLG